MRLFYTAVRIEWPSNYLTAQDAAGLIVRRSVQRYLLFVLGPVYLASLLMATVAMREGSHGLLVGLTIGLLHGIRHSGYRIRATLAEQPDSRLRTRGVLLHGTLLLLSLIAALLGGLGPGPFDFVVPPLEEFFIAFWTVALLAVVGVIVINKTKYPSSVEDLSAIAMREAPSDLVNYAREKANEAGVDVRLVLAILYAENLQRPAWFRRLERIKGKVFRRGSYGIMQVSAVRPISDTESIDIAISQHLHKARSTGDVLSSEDIEGLLRDYNDNPAFVALAKGLYYSIPEYGY